MIVSFPMYNFAPLAGAYRRYWRDLRLHLSQNALLASVELPVQCNDSLELQKDLLAHWRDPQLLLSQSCGYPFVHLLHDQVSYVASYSYEQPYCTKEAQYCALLIVHQDEQRSDLQDFAQTTAVCSAPDSFSGMEALRWMIAPYVQDENKGFFQSRFYSGSHRASLAALKAKQAQITSVDCVTWHFLSSFYPQELESLRMFAQSPEVPSLPLITSHQRFVAPLRAALEAVKPPEELKITAVHNRSKDYSIFKEIKKIKARLA